MSCGVCVGGFRELGLGIINGKKKGNEKDIKKHQNVATSHQNATFFLSSMVCLSCRVCSCCQLREWDCEHARQNKLSVSLLHNASKLCVVKKKKNNSNFSAVCSSTSLLSFSHLICLQVRASVCVFECVCVQACRTDDFYL